MPNLEQPSVYDWIKTDVLVSRKPAVWQRLTRLFDTVVGLLASAMAIPLTYQFGDLLIRQAICEGIFDAHCDKDGITAFQYYNVVMGTISTAVILGKVSNSLLEQIFSQMPDSQKAIMATSKNSVSVKIIHLINWILALSSASPESYAAYKTLKPYVHDAVGLFVASDIFTLTSKNNWAARNLASKFFEYYKLKKMRDCEHDVHRVELIDWLDSAKSRLDDLSSEQVSQFFNLYLKDVTNSISDEQAKQIMLHIIELGRLSESGMVMPQSKVKKIVGYFGSFLAIIGAAATFKLGQTGSNEFINWLTRSNTSAAFYASNFLGGTAYFYRISLGVYASKFTFEKFYDWVAQFTRCQSGNVNTENTPLLAPVNSGGNQQDNLSGQIDQTDQDQAGCSSLLMVRMLPVMLSILTLLVSLGGGTPRVAMTDIAFENTEWYFIPLCVCAFLAAFPTNYWANYTTANAIVNSDPKRSAVVNVIAKTRQGVFGMKPECVEELYDSVRPSLATP